MQSSTYKKITATLEHNQPLNIEFLKKCAAEDWDSVTQMLTENHQQA